MRSKVIGVLVGISLAPAWVLSSSMSIMAKVFIQVQQGVLIITCPILFCQDIIKSIQCSNAIHVRGSKVISFFVCFYCLVFVYICLFWQLSISDTFSNLY